MERICGIASSMFALKRVAHVMVVHKQQMTSMCNLQHTHMLPAQLLNGTRQNHAHSAADEILHISPVMNGQEAP